MVTNLKHIPSLTSPQWAFNGHIHTISRSLFGNSNFADVERLEIPTPDGDFLELDRVHNPESEAVVTLFHGLEGSSKRYYMVELMKELTQCGYSVVAVNFRSCGSKMNKKPRFYHAGETGDYDTVFDWVREQYPDERMGAVGFSLGGNALLKYLSEKKETHPLDAASAISVPYDQRLGAIRLSKGFHRVYEYQFLLTLQKKLEQKREQFSDLPEFSGSTIFEFDDQVTAPIHGFKGAEDYYEQCSGRRFVGKVQTPTLLIHSEDDPLCPIQTMPVTKVFQNPHTDYIITERGGHVAFCSKSRGWLNYVIRCYLDDKLDASPES